MGHNQQPARWVETSKYRDTFRRHRTLFSVPVVVSVAFAAWFAFGAARVYRSTASLWIDNGPAQASSLADVPTATASTDPELSNPAFIEQSILSELLGAPTFSLTVGNQSLLRRFVESGSRGGFSPAVLLHRGGGSTDYQIARSISAGVSSDVAGPQVLKLTYTGPTPAVAQSVLVSLIRHLDGAAPISSTLAVTEQLFFEQAQTEATRAVANALASAEAYKKEHPSVSEQTDPIYAALLAAVRKTNRALSNSSVAVSSASRGQGGSKALMRVIDPPSLPAAATVSSRQMALGLLGGLFAGLLMTALAVVVATPDHQRRWDRELSNARWTRLAYVGAPQRGRVSPSAGTRPSGSAPGRC
jgi:hypothetical protein